MKFFFVFFFCFFLVVLLCFFVVFFSFMLDSSTQDKSGSFECGFQPFVFLGLSFSMPFFVVSLMFLLFDIEILLFCFYPIFFVDLFFISFYFFFIVFLVLFFTLYEWHTGVLGWV